MKELSIALIGFRATGKSTVGKALARELNRNFVDMDQFLVASFGRDIECWVRTRGWESFRREESKLLEALAQKGGIVTATGGGVVLEQANRDILKSNFFVVWLKASPETIFSRLVGDPRTKSDRPPLTDKPMREEIEQLLKERSAFYEATAHMTLQTDGATIRQIVPSIVEAARAFEAARRAEESSPIP